MKYQNYLKNSNKVNQKYKNKKSKKESIITKLKIKFQNKDKISINKIYKNKIIQKHNNLMNNEICNQDYIKKIIKF